MNIKEMKQEKSLLEKNISDAITQFHEKTGVCVADITFSKIDVSRVGSTQRKFEYLVEIKAEL